MRCWPKNRYQRWVPPTFYPLTLQFLYHPFILARDPYCKKWALRYRHNFGKRHTDRRNTNSLGSRPINCSTATRGIHFEMTGFTACQFI